MTKTSSFGVSSRIGHDSTEFYKSGMYEGGVKNKPTEPDNPLPEEATNQIFCKSSEHMSEIPDNSVHLMITSPPYNVGKEYDQKFSEAEYFSLLFNVFKETHRVLVDGGRACVNIANVGRKPYLPLTDKLSSLMLMIGFKMRGEIIWNKGAGAGTSMAWGSWMSASNPVLRDTHEYILVFQKGSFTRPKADFLNTISRDDFMEWTKSVWSFAPARAKKVGHPAPFPPELPKRLIHLYSFLGDVVLDPFVGSGTTCQAAASVGRRWVGYDISEDYCALARKNMGAFK